MPPALTFGVEFEFALACLVNDVQPPSPSPYDKLPPALRIQADANTIDIQSHCLNVVKDAINKVLHAAGLRTFIIPESDDDGTEYPKVEFQLSRWLVDYDNSIRFPDDLYDWVRVEINSPVMYFTPASITCVGKVCDLLTSNFRINCNSSCGLHVHIGNADKGFEFRTLQNLMGFLWTYDPVLLTIHPPHRHDCNYARNTRLSSNITRELIEEEKRRLGHQVVQDPNRHHVRETWRAPWHKPTADSIPDPDPPVRCADGLAKIWALEDVNDMSQSLGHGALSKMAVHLDNLTMPYDDDFKRTIEFRQHASTLNARRVIAWVQLVGGLVEWSRDVDAVEYMNLINDGAKIQDSGEGALPSIWALLYRIGLPVPGLFYHKRISETGQEMEEHVLEPSQQPHASGWGGLYTHTNADIERGVCSSPDEGSFEDGSIEGSFEGSLCGSVEVEEIVD